MLTNRGFDFPLKIEVGSNSVENGVIMEYIGFIFAFCVSAYLIYAGTMMLYITHVLFKDKLSLLSLIPLVLGFVFMILTVINAPFTITFN